VLNVLGIRETHKEFLESLKVRDHLAYLAMDWKTWHIGREVINWILRKWDERA
jgi:hypothetical protein